MAAILVARILSAGGWDPTILTAFGEEATPTLQYAEERIGEVATRRFQGHDGKFFFVQANDPLILDPEHNAAVLDRPLYRAQRMLYPLLAGAFGLMPAAWIPWSMIVVNIVALGVGSWAAARWATTRRRSALWGLAFGLNVGLLSEMMIGGSGIVGFGAALIALNFVEEERFVPAAAWMSAAALAREALLLVAFGAAAWMLWSRRDRRAASLLAGAPLAAVILWALYLRMRLGWETGGSQVQEIGLPFRGFAQALSEWSVGSSNFVIGTVVMVVLLRYGWFVARRPSLIGFATVGFLALAVIFTYQVWRAYFDITRAVAPALTGYILAALVDSSPPRPRSEPGTTGAGQAESNMRSTRN